MKNGQEQGHKSDEAEKEMIHMGGDVSKKVTAIIKAFERPHCLDMLIKSIRKYYPDMHIIVADDSKNPVVRFDVEFHRLPADSGISKGRNFLVRQVKTPYLLLLDDDFCFVKETKIEKLLDVLERSDLDIIGGRYLEKKGVRNSQATFLLKNKVLYYNVASKGKKHGVKLYDIVNNFFLAKTETLRKYKWDDRLKSGGEHLDFFLNHKGKIKVAMHPEVFVFHTNDRSIETYNRYRSRGKTIFNPLFMKKYGIKKINRERNLFRPISSVKKYLSKETLKKLGVNGSTNQQRKS